MATNFKIAHIQERFGQQPYFSKQELWTLYQQVELTPNPNTFRWWIHKFKKEHKISAISKNSFALGASKPTYSFGKNTELSCLSRQVTSKFKGIDYCIWTTQILNEFMLLQSNKFMTIVEVESSALEVVFHFLQDQKIPNLFIQPQRKEVAYYMAHLPTCVVLQPLITKAPMNHLHQPTLEKILVDIFADKVLFGAYQGNELSFIFNSVFDKYQLNLTTLGHYASRRGKKQELFDFMRNHTDIPVLI